MKTFLNEDDHTGWNAGFSFHYSDIESDLDSNSQKEKFAHYKMTTNVEDWSVPNCVVMVPAWKMKSEKKRDR